MRFGIQSLYMLFAACVAAQAGAAQPAAGGFCSPPALGAPCATGGAATAGNTEPTPGFALGNPVHLANGNKYQLDIDLPPNASAPDLELVRHYNGLSTQAGTLGRNWTLSYDTQLQRHGDGWRLRQADGSLLNIPAPLPQAHGFTWHGPDNRQLQFDPQGRLIAIRAGRATPVRIQRQTAPHPQAGLITRVEGAGGHALAFHYGTRQGHTVLQAVDTPLGRFHYHYGLPDPASGHATPRLESVTRPDGMQRRYHYEAEYQSGNPYALTGISLRADNGALQRLTTWTYDRHARVNRLQQHGRATPPLQVEYLRSANGARTGITRVLSANGLVGSIRFQRIDGTYRLLDRRLHAGASSTTNAPVQYDSHGRLKSLDGLQLLRTPQGELAGLVPQAPGWPGLAFELERTPGRYAWYSRDTGQTVLHADPGGRPNRLRYANGDTLQLQHDAQGRVIQLEYTAARSSQVHSTRLQWRGRQLARIVHPFETETRQYDAQGRVSRRSLQRPAALGAPPARFQEDFHYDAQGRLLRHGLPEGGALHYTWEDGSHNSRLAALNWEDAQGRVQAVITSQAGQPGYRYGNGLELRTEARHGSHADTLSLINGTETLWLQQRRYDADSRLTDDRHDFPTARHYDHQQQVHDTQSRLQGARHKQPDATTQWWYAWHANGALAALKRNQQSLLNEIRRDASGLPLQWGHFLLEHSPERRLQRLSHADTGQLIAQYRHNAFGHRILKHAAGTTTQYLYAHDRLVAEVQPQGDDGLFRITRRYVYAGLTPVGMILYPSNGPPRLYAVHTDLSGAPRMVTDAQQRLRWLAAYSPTGKAWRVTGDLRFPLRLPGQYEDQETGWHDNLLRTYVPQLGQYLEPDPLGPLPGTDTYGYARQQPWRYADPHGLLLFAFDGTRYSADSMSNTWLLAQAYRDGAAHYHSGPGNSLFLDWDAVVAWNAGRILENQWQALLTSLERQPAGTTVPLDIIGFSRGAALARHFGNRVVSHVQDGLFSVDDPLRGRVTACVDLRFMGLFDTVTQFGIAGSHNHLYDFGVSELWSWVSHAVALHEHRWTFPLTSADAGGAGNVVEAPFVGAHADIGGGLALLSPQGQHPDTGTDSDLAKVALGWMHWQALAASVNFDLLKASDTTPISPLLRDMRSALARSLQQGDRAVAGPSGATRQPYQNNDPRLGQAAREQVEAFIERLSDWRSQSGEVVGTVNMEGYARWLEDTLGWSPP